MKIIVNGEPKRIDVADALNFLMQNQQYLGGLETKLPQKVTLDVLAILGKKGVNVIYDEVTRFVRKDVKEHPEKYLA